MPFAILFFGTGELYKLTLTGIASLLILQLQCYRGMQSVPKEYIELTRMYQKTKLETLKSVLIPHALPNIFTGLRLSLAISWVVLFFVEYSSSIELSGGLGWFIFDARSVGKVENEYAGVLLLGILGYMTDYLIVLAQYRWGSWMKTIEYTQTNI